MCVTSAHLATLLCVGHLGILDFGVYADCSHHFNVTCAHPCNPHAQDMAALAGARVCSSLQHGLRACGQQHAC